MVSHTDGVTTFDFGEWESEVGSRRNPDESLSFTTTATGIAGLEFVVGAGDEKTLILLTAQLEYVFDAVASE